MEKQNPYYMSFAGVAMVRAENKWAAAVKLCETALTLKRNEPQLHLNLAEVYVAAGRRGDALTTLERAAASFGRHAGVQKARLKLGARRPPVLDPPEPGQRGEPSTGDLAAPRTGMGGDGACPGGSFIFQRVVL